MMKATGVIGVRAARCALTVAVCLTSVKTERSSAAEPNLAPDEAEVTAADREHWAFRPLARPNLPDVDDSQWPRQPLDRFVLAGMTRMGLTPMPEADRMTLIRRLSFDLTGLPPSTLVVKQFVVSGDAQAYEKIVDELLASPAYGEKWGQRWLDVARFAETDGFEHDHVRPHAWRYRDWVISALNEDIPYDRFVLWQLAGDQCMVGHPVDRRAAQIATGFALCGPDMPDINDQSERRHVVLNELAATIGSAFLGLQMGCAQCHDHKYDPISQADFYRLRAFFDSTDLFKDHPLEPFEGGKVEQTAAKGRILREQSAAKSKSFVMIAGDFRRRGAAIQAAFPRIANAVGQKVRPPDPGDPNTDLRSQLARWITRSDNPLTARVVVNRQWQVLFGQGLVRSPSDFGIMGDEPQYAELLDWLATELIRSDWSLKALQRQIVCSATYRQASGPFGHDWNDEQHTRAIQTWRYSTERDPDNRFVSRQSRRRLDAEAIRDALLACSDQLSQRRGGPGVMPPLPPEVRKSIRRDHWKVSPDVQDHRRRSVYLFVRRNLRYPFLEVFDRPDASASCAQRTASINATQSLTMLNSELTTQAAVALSAKLSDGDSPTSRRIEQLYMTTLSRPPTDDEMSRAHAFIHAYKRRHQGKQPTESALTALCLAVLNLNEFIYVD